MLIYYFIWLLLFIFSYCEVISFKDVKQKRVLKQNIAFFLLCIFITISGLKGNVGTDYNNYQNLYINTSLEAKYSFLSGVEPGFWYWMKFMSILGSNFTIFWFITCFFNISLKFYVFSKLSPYISLSLAIYFIGLFFERDFDGIRQGIAISISYLAIYYYLKNKLFSYYILLIISITFHYTSAIFILTPIILKCKISEKYIFYIICVALSLMLLNVYLINDKTIILFGNNIITAKLLNYIGTENFGKQTGFTLGILFRLILLYYFIKFKTKIKIKENLYFLLRNGLFFSIICNLLFNNIDILSHRLAYGFREFQIFIFAYLVTAFKYKSDKLIISSFILLYSLILLYRLLNTDHLAPYYLYETIFN